VYAPRGELLVEGDWIRRPTYAKTLATIAKEGPGALYSGAIADDIVAAAQADGGILTHADLAGYRAHTYPAISGQFRGQTVYTADAPASGGVMLGMLQIMDPLLAPLTGAECYGEEQSHQLIEAMKFAFGARSEVCDPRFARNLTRLAEFRTPAWADAQRAKITNTTHEPGYYGLETEPITDSGTTHLSVVDQWGGAASVTSTVNLIWGSHVMAPNTGIILNDEQDDFAVPGAPDAFGLPPSPHNYPAPGKRPLSSTAPTIVHAPDGRVVGVLGGSGGSRIFPAVAMVLLNLACGDDISQAIERPRMHDQVLPPITTLEVGPEGVDKDWLAALKKRGHKIGQFDINVGASEVQAVVVDKRGVWAASDSRKNGVAAGY
jgi:gamma-glutamyltranspeptidase/glutathione hydrolase/leukotriene-C4 hydrolase